MTEDEITDSMDMSLSRLWEIVKDREAWHTTVYGVKKSDMTLQLTNNNHLPQILSTAQRARK